MNVTFLCSLKEMLLFWGGAMTDVAIQTTHPCPACTVAWCTLKYGSNNLHFRPLNSAWETQTEGGYSKKCCDVQKPAILTSLPTSCFKCLKWKIKNKKLFLIFTQLLSSHPLFEQTKVKPWMPLKKRFPKLCNILCPASPSLFERDRLERLYTLLPSDEVWWHIVS